MEDFVIEDGVLNVYTGPGGDVVIPDGVMRIGDEAFNGCSDLTGITIPSSVMQIGESAFEDCSSLTSITIPFGVTHIWNGTFSECRSLAGVAIPASVTSIENRAFCGCTSLTGVTIPASVTSIGDRAFCECISLTSLTILDDVTSNASALHKFCASMQRIYKCFARLLHKHHCACLDEDENPRSLTIGEDAFRGCSSLTGITIPASVTSIGQSAFSECSGLTSVTLLGKAREYGKQIFADCPNLRRFENLSGVPVLREFALPSSVLEGCLPGEDLESLNDVRKYTAVSCYLSCPERYSSEDELQYITYIDYFGEELAEFYLRKQAGDALAAFLKVYEPNYETVQDFLEKSPAPEMTAVLLEYQKRRLDAQKARKGLPDRK